jgi:hypothetical protein
MQKSITYEISAKNLANRSFSFIWWRRQQGRGPELTTQLPLGPAPPIGRTFHS